MAGAASQKQFCDSVSGSPLGRGPEHDRHEAWKERNLKRCEVGASARSDSSSMDAVRGSVVVARWDPPVQCFGIDETYSIKT